MADTPEKKTSKASVEASLASKLQVMSMMPRGFQEQALEGYANKALPDGSEQERDEFRRYWRERLDRERELLDRERERRDRPGTLPRGGYPIQETPNGAMEYPAHFSAEARAAVEAAEMFVSLPEYSGIQVWMQDRLNKLAAAATNECSLFGSKACARVALSRYNIKAAAFRRLVSDIKLQNAFMTLLNHWEDVAWSEFTGIGTPKEIRSGAPSIAPGLARRKRWWIRQGYKQLESLRQAQHVSDRESQPAPPANAAEMQAQQTDLPDMTDSPAPGSEQEEFKQPTFTRGIPGVGETSIVEPLVKVIDGPLTKSPARKGGRPVILVDGERIKELRGEYSQVVFARFCKVSVDAVQRAEHHGRSSDKTIRRIVRKLRGQGHKIEVKDLIKNPPQ